jgi:hypothetical protein
VLSAECWVGAGFIADVDCPNVGKPALVRRVTIIDRQREPMPPSVSDDRRQGGFPGITVI